MTSLLNVFAGIGAVVMVLFTIVAFFDGVLRFVGAGDIFGLGG